jgi:AcrR family transcriptional regulator
MPDSRRTPRQERGIQTRQRILEAARIAVAEQGWARTTTRDIAARAGIGAATLYGYFAELRPILLELFDLHYGTIAEKMGASLESAFAGGELGLEALKGFIDALLDFHREEGSFHAEMESLAERDAEVGARRSAFDARIVEGIAKRLEAAGVGSASGSIAATAWIAYRAIEAIVHEASLSGPDQSRPGDEAIVEEAAAMLSSYLFGGKA